MANGKVGAFYLYTRVPLHGGAAGWTANNDAAGVGTAGGITASFLAICAL